MSFDLTEQFMCAQNMIRPSCRSGECGMQAMKNELSLPARRMARFRLGFSCRLPAEHTPARKERERGVSHSNSISRLDVSLKHFSSYDSSTPEFEAYEK